MHLHATPNAYQRAYPAYDETPKAVIAAVAYGLALRLCEDDPEAAAALLRAEWAITGKGSCRSLPASPCGAGQPPGARRGANTSAWANA